MKKLFFLIAIFSLLISCRNEKSTKAPSGLLQVAKDIVTEVIVNPDTTGDPWEAEKVAGYNGVTMINDIFEDIYKGKLIAKDYHTGEILKASDIKSVEQQFDNDRSRIGKLSFTEDWYYDPVKHTVIKSVKSFTLGYERKDIDGRVLGYNAVFMIEVSK